MRGREASRSFRDLRVGLLGPFTWAQPPERLSCAVAVHFGVTPYLEPARLEPMPGREGSGSVPCSRCHGPWPCCPVHTLLSLVGAEKCYGVRSP